MNTWNLRLLYKSNTDPQIERDCVLLENAYARFAKKYGGPDRKYLTNNAALLSALKDYEKLCELDSSKPLLYFFYSRDINSGDKKAASECLLLDNRLTKMRSQISFFTLSLGTVSKNRQGEILSNTDIKHYRFLLQCIFRDAKYDLSVVEEKIMSLKSMPAHDMWVTHTNKILNSKTVSWQGKDIAISSALNIVVFLKSAKQRKELSSRILDVLTDVARFAEGEINAIVTNKKINDELRGYARPQDATIVGYNNDPKVVDGLVSVISENLHIAHRFYGLKSRLMKQKKLNYCDRMAPIGTLNRSFSFDNSYKKLMNLFSTIDPKYSKMLAEFYENGQIDVYPKKGKKGGAYCWASYGNPTFVLLNDVGNLHSYTTFAHEMGHAFHNQLAKIQGPLYSSSSISVAETASTLFEAIALDAVYEDLTDKEKIIVLHDKISDDLSIVFRQIAFYNFELDLHREIRKMGYLSKEEIAKLLSKHLASYLGHSVNVTEQDGYAFVSLSHMRRFFYVYTYAYGQLVSKALLHRYKKDKSFWKSIEKLLSSGGSATPEELLKSIGIDVTSKNFFLEGIKEIEADIIRLEKLIK